MIARSLWFAAIIVVALVTSAAQLDRQARVTPALASIVPEPFRAFAQTGITVSALSGEDAVLAVQEAETLVRRRPYPAQNLSLLAAAQFKAGEIEAGARTVQIAAKRGWRDPLAQESVLRLALAAGDYPEATRRYTALFLNKQTDEALLLEIGKQLFAETGGPGRQTFIEIVSGGERWLGTLLNLGPRVLPPEAFVEIVLKSSKNGTQFDCGGIERAANLLGGRDAAAADGLTAEFSDRC